MCISEVSLLPKLILVLLQETDGKQFRQMNNNNPVRCTASSSSKELKNSCSQRCEYGQMGSKKLGWRLSSQDLKGSAPFVEDDSELTQPLFKTCAFEPEMEVRCGGRHLKLQSSELMKR